MGTTVLDGRLLARMMRSGAANLYGSKDTVNDLNVFPIPDGDTMPDPEEIIAGFDFME